MASLVALILWNNWCKCSSPFLIFSSDKISGNLFVTDLFSYNANPINPIAIPPKNAMKSKIASDHDAFPAKASFAVVAVVSHDWVKTSIIKKIKMPRESAFRNPFCLGLRCGSKASGRPKKIVNPAIAPSKRSCQ